jgi:1-acyl-sn-glycerol-3-phosphate acyltransferase
MMIRFFGALTWPRFNFYFDTHIEGTEHISELPRKNVLIVSNHQTYFADALLMQHAFHSALCGKPNTVRYPGFLFVPHKDIYLVAARETVENTMLTRFMDIGGVLMIQRTWKKDGQDVKIGVNPKDPQRMKIALRSGWVVSFPQGTTKPFVPGRKGTAHLIKETECIVVPVVIDGFRRAFDKTGVKKKKKGVTLKMKVKAPLKIDYTDSVENILEQVMDAIEQSPKFDKRTET